MILIFDRLGWTMECGINRRRKYCRFGHLRIGWNSLRKVFIIDIR